MMIHISYSALLVLASILGSTLPLTVHALQHGQNTRTSLAMNSSNSMASKPHIVFVLMDDLGYTDTGYAGGETYTPTFDKLAKEGTVLENYYAYSSCAPTRAAIMTGRHGPHTGIILAFAPQVPMAVSQKDKMIPEALKKNGYATHMVGKWHLGAHKWENTPSFRGFDSFYGFLGWQETYYGHDVVGGIFTGKQVYDLHYQKNSRCGDGCHTVQLDDRGNYSTELYSKRAVDIINDHDPETPLFLYLAEQAPHGPLEPPPDTYLQSPYLPTNTKRDETFAGVMAAADARFKDVYDALESKGMIDHTVIIFSSDNGGPISTVCCESTGSSNYPHRGAKHTLFEGGIRVTGFVWSGSKAPQVKKGSHYKGLMHAVDWFPTIMHLAGDESSAQKLDGVDQWSALHSGTPAQEHLFLGGMYEEDSQTLLGVLTEKEKPFAYAVRDGNWKLIVGSPGRNEFNGWSQKDLRTFSPSLDLFSSESVLLYNLVDDPREEKDMADSKPDIVERLKDVANLYVTNLVGREHATDLACPDLDPSKVDALLPWC